MSIETGRIGLQANGAVMVTEGETVMYTTICAGREVTADGGFVPLTVNYQVRSQPSTTVEYKTRPLITPYTLPPTPYTLLPTPYTPRPTPFSLRPTPYTLRPTTYNLQPTTYTLRSTPQILNPKP